MKDLNQEQYRGKLSPRMNFYSILLDARVAPTVTPETNMFFRPGTVRETGEVYKRNTITSRLYRMIQKGIIYPVGTRGKIRAVQMMMVPDLGRGACAGRMIRRAKLALSVEGESAILARIGRRPAPWQAHRLARACDGVEFPLARPLRRNTLNFTTYPPRVGLKSLLYTGCGIHILINWRIGR